MDIRQPAVAASTVSDGGEIDLLELFFVLAENMKYIVLSVAVFALIAGLYTQFLVVPLYEATAKLYVLNSGDSAINLSDLQIGSYLTTDYQEVFKTWELHEMVKESLDLPYTYEELGEMLKVSNPSNTRILYITVSSPNPEEATAMANEYAYLARKFISETMATEQPNVLSAALQPEQKASPNLTLNVFIGAFLGALLAVGVFVVRFMLDDKLRSAEDILRYTGLPTLAIVPAMNGRNDRKSKGGTT